MSNVALTKDVRLFLRMNSGGKQTLMLYRSGVALPKGKVVNVGEKVLLAYDHKDHWAVRVFGLKYEYYVLCSDLPSTHV